MYEKYQTWLPQENQSLQHNLLHKIPTMSIFSKIDKKAYIYVNAKMIMWQNRTLPAVRVSVNMVLDATFINISVIWWHSSCCYNCCPQIRRFFFTSSCSKIQHSCQLKSHNVDIEINHFHNHMQHFNFS